MQKIPKSIFISGTDTSVGKTLVTSLLALCLKNSGRKVGVIKPLQTGTESEPFLDVDFIYKVLDQNFKLDEVCPFRLKKPLSPYSAAKFEDCEIPIKQIIDHCKGFINKYDVTLIEGAGGLYVPIAENYLMTDLAFDLDASLLLVTRPGLGTLNHTLLSVEHIKHKKVDLMGIIINGWISDPDIASLTNLDVFHNLYKLAVMGVVPNFGNIDFNDEKIELIKGGCEQYFSSLLGGSFNYEEFVKTL